MDPAAEREGFSGEHATGIVLEAIDPDRPQPFDTPWGSYALFVLEGSLVAVQSFCPHLLGPLFQGTRSGPGGNELTCPWHGWRYSLTSGACVDSPRDEGRGTRVRFLAVRIDAEGGVHLVGPPRASAPPGPSL